MRTIGRNPDGLVHPSTLARSASTPPMMVGQPIAENRDGNAQGIDEAFNLPRFVLVAGARFEPATFGL